MDIIKVQETERELKRMAKLLKCGIFEVSGRVEALINRINLLEKERDRLWILHTH